MDDPYYDWLVDVILGSLCLAALRKISRSPPKKDVPAKIRPIDERLASVYKGGRCLTVSFLQLPSAMSYRANKRYGPKPHNYTMLQAFEWYTPGGGKHWKTLQNEIPKLADIGITGEHWPFLDVGHVRMTCHSQAMWLPPPTKAASKVNMNVLLLLALADSFRRIVSGTWSP